MTGQLAMGLTYAQQHEIAKIEDGDCRIVEQPEPWGVYCETVPEGSVVLTYHVPSSAHSGWFVETIITPDGRRLRVQ